MNNAAGKPRNRNPIKIMLWIIAGLFLLLLVRVGVRVVQSSIDQRSQPDTNAAHYLSCRWDHWVEDEPYRLFPSKSVMQNCLEYFELSGEDKGAYGATQAPVLSNPYMVISMAYLGRGDTLTYDRLLCTVCHELFHAVQRVYALPLPHLLMDP